VITQALGNGGELDIEIQDLDLGKTDRLLLCSDGLSGMVSDPQILDIVEETPDLQSAVDSLIAMAREHGGEDNITAVLVASE
jgi:protein phosphatase